MPVPSLSRRRLIAALAALAVGAAAVHASGAQEVRFFQLGTGPTGEIRFPLGGLIANAISNPPGSRECERGGSCGVPGLVAVAKSTGGSVANVEGIAARRLDAALVDADVAWWATTGQGLFKGRKVDNLRAIAVLYRQPLQLVAATASGIRSVRDLKGKRVSLGERDSIGLLHGRQVLAALGVAEAQMRLSFLKPEAAADAVAAGKLDAFLAIDAAPMPLVAELAETAAITVLPLAGAELDRLRAAQPYYEAVDIAVDTYPGVARPVATLAVPVLLMTGAEQPESLIEGITRALWHPSTQRLLAEGHPRGRQLHLDAAAVQRLGLSPHPGAVKALAGR